MLILSIAISLLIVLLIIVYFYGRNDAAKAYWRGRQEGIDAVQRRALEQAKVLAGYDPERIKKDLFQ